MSKSLTELKALHESGAKTRKDVGRRIEAELKRVCGYKTCDQSLAFWRKDLAFCTSSHRNKEATRIKAANRLKKQRYYEKRGIKFDKTVRNRKITADNIGQGVLWSGQTLLYEHYKEPLKPVEKSQGYGYYGTVALTDDKQYVQCHICGHLFPNVGAHLRKHKITAEKYKETYQLAQTTALISEPVRERLQEKAVKHLTGRELPPWLKDYNAKVQSGEIVHKFHGRTTMPLEKRNEKGLCPDQVLEKIKDLADELGRTPSFEEFEAHYKSRYLGSIKFQHGSWTNAVKKATGQSREELRRIDKDKLIDELQAFHKQHNRIPMTSDFNRGLLRNRGAYISKFGSLNNARIEAGMNAVVPLPFGQVVELTPQQYMEYQAGHPVISEASTKKRQQRKLLRLRKKELLTNE